MTAGPTSARGHLVALAVLALAMFWASPRAARLAAPHPLG